MAEYPGLHDRPCHGFRGDLEIPTFIGGDEEKELGRYRKRSCPTAVECFCRSSAASIVAWEAFHAASNPSSSDPL